MDFSLDIMGQLTFVRTYIQLCFCFPLEDGQQARVIDDLKSAARKLTKDIPYLNGQVINEGLTEDSSGTYRIARYEEHEKNTFIYSKDVPDLHYETIIKAKGPFGKFNDQVIAPRTMSIAPYDLASGPAPVFIVQANFISGGLILTFAGQHQTMDMNGFAKVIQYFARAINNNHPLSTEERTEALRDRTTVFSYLKDDEKSADLSAWDVPADAPPPSMIDCRWTTWRFKADHLAKLKAQANADCDFKDGVTYLTTNDVLVASFWKALTLARMSNLSADVTTQFARTIDVRKVMKPLVSPYYIGQAVGASYTDISVRELTTAPIWKSAFLIRRDTNAIDDHWVRSMASLFTRTPDMSTINPTWDMDLNKDLVVTSWVTHPLQEIEFGKLGRTTLLRCPTMAPIYGFGLLLPHTVEGDIDMAIALGEETIEQLRGNEEFMSGMEYIG